MYLYGVQGTQCDDNNIMYRHRIFYGVVNRCAVRRDLVAETIYTLRLNNVLYT